MKILTKLAVLGLFAVLPAHANVLHWQANLAPEANRATGSGNVELTFDSIGHDLVFSAAFTGLSGTTTVAHFHCCTANPGTGTAGVAVDAPNLQIPTGVSAGSWSETRDLDDPNNFSAAFLSNNGGTTNGAIAALLAGFDAGTAYFNIHSSLFPGGEIRGFPTRVTDPVPVPVPGTLALMLLGFAAVSRRRTCCRTR